MNLPDHELSPPPRRVADLPSHVHRIHADDFLSHPICYPSTSGNKEPSPWPDKIGDKTKDGSIVWTMAGKVVSLADRITADQLADEALKAQWALGDYEPYDCANCGRQRVCKCPNGKHRCEKCNWVPEDRAYAPVSNR